MGFLSRAISRGIREGVGKAVGDAITKAVEPAATELANKASAHIDNVTQNVAQQQAAAQQQASGLEGIFSGLEKKMQGYATELSKNFKICPNCEQPVDASKKFCPSCGTELPEQTMAEGAVCTSCGKQNDLGTKFCADCGTKLPIAIQEEQAAAAADAKVLDEWDSLLDVYPKWNCGGSRFRIDDYGDYITFGATFPSYAAASRAVKEYGELAKQHGFHPAGQYPSEQHLYNRINGVCYGIDLEHCFEGDSESPSIGFHAGEPTGGYDYVKPEPQKKASFKDLFGL